MAEVTQTDYAKLVRNRYVIERFMAFLFPDFAVYTLYFFVGVVTFVKGR